MKKITNSSELSKYYSVVNNCIDEYIKTHKVTPSEIYRYINKNLQRFLEKFSLRDIDGIERVVKDVIEHKRNMEKDKVFKFEQFTSKLNESILDVAGVSIDHEKVLADFYNTSLGHIKVIDPVIHLYEIKDFDRNSNCIIFSVDEINSVKSKVSEQIIKELSKQSVSINSLDGNSLSSPISFLVGSMISDENIKSYIDSKLNGDQIIQLISDLIPNRLVGFQYSSCKYEGVFDEYHIWSV